MSAIETHEIQGALTAISNVRDVSLLAPEDQAAMSRMAGYLARLLDRTSDNDATEFVDATTAARGEPKTVHQLFEAQARKTPENIAIAYEGNALTYAELNAKANRLAHYLRSRGVVPDTLVGIFMERSLDMIIGLLGILKAGGAYIPLDPAYPRERLAYMLDHAKPVLLLTQPNLQEKIPAKSVPSLCLDVLWDSLKETSTDNPVNRTLPGHLAYVIYTSGSTGEPKGVAGQAGALVNRLDWMQSTFPCHPGEKHIQKTSINFIDSVTETLGPLLSGGQLCIAPTEISRDPELLWQFIDRNDIARIVLVPSLLEAMLRAEKRDISQKMELIICSGEALPPGLVGEVRQLLPSTKLLNLYGSSEVTGDVTFHLCRHAIDPALPIPLGRPIDNSQIYILDRDLQPVPLGVVGELYVAGDGLARGYLNRPDLTAERFIPNPYSREGGRMYRSGDLARYMDNGDIEYLGRVGHQVKIRGFRIELGEIEAALLRQPEVREAVVLAREDIAGDKRLVAYVVAHEPASLNTDELRLGIGQILPEYMVPAYFVSMESLPLSPNGKLDRKALPAPEKMRGEADYVAPQTPMEKNICEVWSEVLGIERIGVADNFFDLGGHSLLVMTLIGRLKKIDVSLSVQQIYKNPTVSGMISCLAKNSRQDRAAKQGSETGSAPLLANHHWFLKRKNPNHWNAALLLEPLIAIDVPALKQAIADSLEHHDGMRRILNRSGEKIEQLVQPLESMAPWWDYVDLSGVDEQSLRSEIEKRCSEVQVSLDVFSVLFKVLYIDLGEGRRPRLLILAHRLLLDPVSRPIFYVDLVQRYIASTEKNKHAFPEKTASVKAWAEWQWNYAQEGALKHLPYWESRAWHKYRALPQEEVDVHPSTEICESVSPHFVCAELNQDETLALEQAAFDSGLQIDCILVTALMLAYQRWTGATALFLLFMTNGRVVRAAEDFDLGRTVGWLPNYSPIMFDWDADDAKSSLKNVVHKIKDQMHQLQDDGLSYSCLRYMNTDHRVNSVMNSLPEFQLEFSYLPKVEDAETIAVKDIGAFTMRVADEHFGEEEGEMDAIFAPFVKSYHHEGKLKMRWGYSPRCHSERTMQKFIDDQFDYLRKIIKDLKTF